MIIYELRIKKYSWIVTILYKCSTKNLQEVGNYLSDIDCPAILINEATKVLQQNNTGLTYSNYSLRHSIMVFNNTTSDSQMVNSVTHECYHLVNHINRSISINNEERLATLMGDLCMNIYTILKQ